MKAKLLLSFLCLAPIVGHAQSVLSDDYAKPAFRSPVVAVEFTGQRCRYCPGMSRALQNNQEYYGKENYIITALHHLADFSLLPEKHVSLYNPEAQEYASSIKIHPGLPQLVYNTLGPEVSDLVLDDMFKEDDLLECTGNAYYNDDKKYVLDIQTRLRSNQVDVAKDKKIDILFWALENDIVALQDDSGEFVYPSHQHIFRGSLNGTWGESYSIGSRYTAAWDIPKEVLKVENTEVVVFFLDHDTRTILDAGQFKVTYQSSTGIDDVVDQDNPLNEVVYDLSGRAVRRLEKGRIYIRNGKKIISE